MQQEIWHRLIQDNDCHWYVIEVGQEEEFHKWVEYMENVAAEYAGHDFNENRINGYHTTQFREWRESI